MSLSEQPPPSSLEENRQKLEKANTELVDEIEAIVEAKNARVKRLQKPAA